MAEDNSRPLPWSLIPKSDIKNYVHLVNLDLKALKNSHKDKKHYIDRCEFHASRVVDLDNEVSKIKSPSGPDFWDQNCRGLSCELIKVYTVMSELCKEDYEFRLKRQPELFQGLAAMDTQVMEKLLAEYTAEEDILTRYMQTYEIPLLPEGPVYEKYRRLRARVDRRLAGLEIRIQELKDEIKTGQALKDCIEYEKEFGQGAKDFVMIWILNRALVFVLTLQ
jgi:hypothetical protein